MQIFTPHTLFRLVCQSEVLGYWAVGLIFLGAVPAVMLNICRNRHVEALTSGS